MLKKTLYESPSSEELEFLLEGNYVQTNIENPGTDPEGGWDDQP